MNILIINQPPFNRGDESAHKGLVRTLLAKLPDAQITVLSKREWSESVFQYRVLDDRVKYSFEPLDYFGLSKIKEVGMKRKMRFLWSLHPLMHYYKIWFKWSDIVLCAPGGICMGGFQNWDHLFMLQLAKYYRKPLAYFGRSFGPFPTETKSNRLFKALSIEMLKYFSFLSLRDSRSEKLAREMGYFYVSTVDTAFLDSPIEELPYEIKWAIGDHPYMVFVPNYLLWHYAYKNKISHDTIINFYDRMIDVIWDSNPDYNIVMLPQLFGRDYYYPLSDIQLFRELANKKSDDRIIVVSDKYGSDIQQTIISRAKYVIGARYHSIVFSINQNVPFISLSYEHKMSGLLETLDKMEWCVDFTNTFDNDITQNETLEKVRGLIPSLQQDEKIQEKAKKIAMHGMDVFIEFLKDIV